MADKPTQDEVEKIIEEAAQAGKVPTLKGNAWLPSSHTGNFPWRRAMCELFWLGMEYSKPGSELANIMERYQQVIERYGLGLKDEGSDAGHQV